MENFSLQPVLTRNQQWSTN